MTSCHVAPQRPGPDAACPATDDCPPDRKSSRRNLAPKHA